MLWLSLLLGLCALSPSFAQDERIDVIGTLNIPLTITNDNRYAVQVVMGSSGTPQNFNFTVSTTAGYSLVAANGCTTCGAGATYNAASSGSERNLPGTGGVALGDAMAQGGLIKENCTLKQTNGSQWAYPNQTIISVTSTNTTSGGVFNGYSSGLIGLGLTAPNLSFPDTIPGGFFNRNPNSNTFVFGMQLTPPQSSGLQQGGPAVAGNLHWLAPDPSAYQGNVTTINVTPPSSSSVQTPLVGGPDWQVPLGGWTVEVGSAALNNQTGGTASIDPYFPQIYLPLAEAQSIYNLVSGAVVATTTSIYTEWSIPCNTQMTWSANLQGTPFAVPSSTLVVPSGSSCVGAIRGWADPAQGGYLLGSSFISSVYLIFSVNKDPASPNSLGVAMKTPYTPPSSKKSTPVGAIVGGTIGGVAVIALIVFGTWFMMQRNRQINNEEAAIKGGVDEKTVNPLSLPPVPHTGNSEFSFSSMNKEPSSTGLATYDPSVSVPNSPTPAMSVISRNGGESAYRQFGADYQGSTGGQGSSHGISSIAEGEFMVEPYVHPSSAAPQSSKQRQLQQQQQQQAYSNAGNSSSHDATISHEEDHVPPPMYTRAPTDSASTAFSPTDTLVNSNENGRPVKR